MSSHGEFQGPHGVVLTPGEVIRTVFGSAVTVAGWLVSIAFASLFAVATLSGNGNDVLSWWAAWEMGNGIRGRMDTPQLLGAMVWNAMVSAGLWQLMAAVPVWRISRRAHGNPRFHVFGRVALLLGCVVLINPRGLLRGDQLPFLLNLDAITWTPALILLGCAFDAQFFGRGALPTARRA